MDLRAIIHHAFHVSQKFLLEPIDSMMSIEISFCVAIKLQSDLE
jgi:hypothetical protein